MVRQRSRKSTLETLSIEQLLCRAFFHAWLDKDMLAMIWGTMKVEQWHLECDRCHSGASEYRDPVTCERIGQRQYQHAPGYSLDYRYTKAEFFQELSRRRKAAVRAAKRASKQVAG
jgi:hypothetical protein